MTYQRSRSQSRAIPIRVKPFDLANELGVPIPYRLRDFYSDNARSVLLDTFALCRYRSRSLDRDYRCYCRIAHKDDFRLGLKRWRSHFCKVERIPDETLTLNGIQVPCSVVKISSLDRKRPPKPGIEYKKTVWIEIDNANIRKIVTHEHRPKMMVPGFSEDIDTTELYPVVELDGQIPDNVFTFIPPQTASLLEKFHDPFSFGNDDLTGKPAPSLTFKSTDNKAISLASLRGKPVLVDFWATWCLPCVASMPQMAEIYQQTKDKGLVFLGVDEDQDAKTAADYLAQVHHSWLNFHDSGDIKKAFNKLDYPLPF
jgi:thiol-disulfide isomerase/thioredoxin